jgi:predicted negative regulator of RcsB-dependent stress response
MAYDLEEQEKIDALKAWWNQNARLVSTALLAAALAAAGVSGWRWYHQRQGEQASALYAALEQAVGTGDAQQARQLCSQLMERYPGTVYGPMAALVAAKISFDAGDLKSAGSQLEWATQHARDEETAAVARLRLAAVRLDERRYDEALAALGEKHPESFDGLYADLRGDVLVAQGKIEEARAAYRQALEKLPPGSGFRRMVQVKLDGIGGGGT